MEETLKTKNIKTAKRYINLLGKAASPSEFGTILHPKVNKEEFANLYAIKEQQPHLNCNKGLQEMAKNKTTLISQGYAIRHVAGDESWVAMEVIWKGILREGKRLRTLMGYFLQFQEGLIICRRHYDCDEAFD